MSRITAPLVAIAICVLLTGGCDQGETAPMQDQPTSAATEESPIEAASAALDRGEFLAAERAITKHLVQDPTDPTGLELAGDIAVASGNSKVASELYQAAVTHSDAVSAALYDKYGRQRMNAGDPYGAVEVLRESIEAHPELAKTRADFAGLAASLGMVEHSAEHLRWLLRRGHGGLNELIMLANLGIPQTDKSICDYALKHNPADRRPQYPLALTEAFEGDWEKAAERLQEVTETHPDFAPAWALYGRVLVELDRRQALQQWNASRPPDCDRWTAYWMAAGYWAERQGVPAQAASAFRQAVQIDNANGEALVHLASNLSQIGDLKASKAVAASAADVNAMNDSIESLFSWRKNSQQAAIQVAESMKRLGRVWEAEAWARSAFSMTQQIVPNVGELHALYRSGLTSKTPWQLAESSPLVSIETSELPEFGWALSDKASDSPDPSESERADVPLRFEDQAEARGLVHRCGVRDLTQESAIQIFHSNGGGAGVIDFDLDGWPDLYLTSTDGRPMEYDSSPNRLFRNLAGSFRDATDVSMVGDRGFTQGVAVGDYNADGFADVFVANIGRNRLYRNNGDGSFTDVSEEAGLSGEFWTSSAAIADLDADSVDDLFEVQYCAGDQVYTQRCLDAVVGQPRSCSPLAFPAESDRTWAGDGRGGFREISRQWLQDQKPGHGLGIIVGGLDEVPGLDVYVANDMTANQFWSSRVVDDGHQFSDQAAVRGLAVNGRSQSQASMGIAAGDADGDGDLDLFLTHFTDDYNTYYAQVGPGIWVDQTSKVGLDTPSMTTLAFGCEWIDVDNDGQVELIVANGNVDDFSHQGNPLRMLPQLFRRTSGGRWAPVLEEELGAYFHRPVVGRALVTVDVDRDGRTDSVVTHLFDPVSVLVNRTPTAGRSIRFWLRGRESSRDAIGATVRLDVDGESRLQQLTAGDGYQCSNERCLSFGVGESIDSVHAVIRWPSGREQDLGDLTTEADYLVIEGDEEAYRLAAFEPRR